MNPLMALAVSIGVLLGVSNVVFGVIHISIWPAIVSWGCFFAAGGKMDGLSKTIVANIAGVFWVFVATAVIASLGGSPPVAAVVVGLVGFILVAESKLPFLGFIPGAFVGAGIMTAYGNYRAPGLSRFVLSLVLGAVLGYLSEMLAGKLKKA